MAKKILFIEDEAALQQAAAQVLTEEGFEVFSALDGEIGLKLAKEKQPDLILLDLVLPKKDGFEVLKALKEDPLTKNIPVLVLTNLEGSDDVRKVLELGATTYLVKTSYKLEDIVDKVRQTLGNR